VLGGQLYGNLGNGTMDTTTTPTQAGGANWARVAAGNWSTCAIKTDKTLWCWGNDTAGQLGDGSTTEYRPIPAQVGDAQWASVTVGGGHACGVRDDGTLWCWGANVAGQLGIGSNIGSPTPAQIGDGLRDPSIVPMNIAGIERH